MIDAFQSGAPDRAPHAITKKGDLKCVRLMLAPSSSDNAGTPDDPDAALLRRYSPEFVILPEVAGSAARPYPKGKHDYQPHAVGLYLADIGTVRQVPMGRWGYANVIATGLGYSLLALAFVLALGGADGGLVLCTLALSLGIAGSASGVAVLYRYARTPANQIELREAAKRPDRATNYAMTMFPTPGAGSPEQAWKKYRKRIETEHPPSLVYGRVQEDGGLKVLQYWLFHYYNDWWNQHEADWEVAMVFLDAKDRPLAVACSSHLAGTWRSWDATEPVGPDKMHPLVYVARGSHALYFNTADGVHDAVLHQPWAIFDFKGKLTVRGQQDSVGKDVLGKASYELCVIPAGAEKLRTDDPGWPDWWWLQFQGRWGAKDGILSPAISDDGLRWDHPTAWADCVCDADSSSWRDVIKASLMAREAE